ncbi:unnamed protein product [Pedinophyceae sp. YPF-701]|nr:unnamed protein product [Pedinophyceae sp. YPF-701]
MSGDVKALATVEELRETMQQATAQNQLVAIKFSAEWCGPCRQLAPLWDRWAPEFAGRVQFCAVDVDAARGVVAECPPRVTSLPTIQLWKAGRLVWSQAGARNLLAALRAAVDEHSGEGRCPIPIPDPEGVLFKADARQAVANATKSKRPLVVFLVGSGTDSTSMIAQVLARRSPCIEPLRQCVTIALPDDLNGSVPEHEARWFQEAKFFRQLFPTDTLPSMAIVSPHTGQPVVYQRGFATAARTSELLAEGIAACGGASPSSGEQAQPGADVGAGSTAPQGAATTETTTAKEKTHLLQFKLTDGKLLTHSFAASATVGAVLEWLRGARTDGDATVQVWQQLPKRNLSDPELSERTLADLEMKAIVPVKLVAPEPEKPSPPPPAAPVASEQQSEGAPSAGAPEPDASEGAASEGASEGPAAQRDADEPMSEPAPPPPPPPADVAIQFRLTDGGSLQHKFAAGTKLAEAVEWVRANRTDGSSAFILAQTFPTRELGDAEAERTLEELGLAPRSTLVLATPGGAARGGVATLSDLRGGASGSGGGNEYWNGNSTSFGGGGGGGGGITAVSGARDWERVLRGANNKPVIVDFAATWCGPCKMIAPKFEALAREHGGAAVFCKVDVDEASDVASACGVSAMPTFQVWIKGEKVDEVRGANEGALRVMVARALGR